MTPMGLPRVRWFVVLFAMLLAVPVARVRAAGVETINFPLRGKTLTLSVYRPSGPPKGTIVMASGDVGWVGLSASLSEFMAQRGYVMVGVNTRQYLAAFTDGKKHLTVDDTPADYNALRQLLESRQLLYRPTILSGVSEGASITVLAASDEKNHAWADGVITMGLPASAELAWRWRDFTSWITKSIANEPTFSPMDYVGRIAPLPLVMIQSMRDEYVPEADYRKYEATANPPKKLVLIDSSNHRFTDRQDRLHAEFLSALAWISTAGGKDKSGRP